MPINNRYNQGDNLFTRATAEAVVRHKNNNPGVDPDTGNVDGGICSGITSAWVVSVLHADAVPAAVPPAGFPAFFEVLRFQGAYFKELHGKADTHLNALGQAMQVGVCAIGTVNARPVTAPQLPAGTQWAAYVSLQGHVIGAARRDGNYYLVDPNFGCSSIPPQVPSSKTSTAWRRRT